MVAVNFGGSEGSNRYRCLTDQSQEGDGRADMSYSLELPDTFVNANKAKLNTGLSTICIVGGGAIRTKFGAPDYVYIPLDASIRFVERVAQPQERQLLQTKATGTKSVLVVRVSAPGSAQSSSVVDLANSIFGIGGKTVNMASQYSACSFGKLTFVPASGYSNVTNGVLDITLSASVDGLRTPDLENTMNIEVQKALGVSSLNNNFDNILFCMPSGTTNVFNQSYASYAYLNGPFSYFSDGKSNVLD